MVFLLTILFLVELLLPLCKTQTDGFSMYTPLNYNLLKQAHSSFLFEIDDGGSYFTKPYLLVLEADDHYLAGVDYGLLFGEVLPQTYDRLLESVLGNSGMERFALEAFLDWQWESYLSKQVPSEYFDEIRGIKDGGNQLGVSGLDTLINRVLTISNFPGDIESNIAYLLETEALEGVHLAKWWKHELKGLRLGKGMSCSFFSVWGSRTENGQLFTMRNLDWDDDTGINTHKLLTIYKIKGEVPYATVGFAGLIGSLAGISSAGLTVHETGNDVVSPGSTFNGFPWVLRLRHIMANARNLTEALNIWQQTNNTMGMNHQIASAADLSSNHPARALETMGGYTAYFMDNDPRESALTYTDPNTGSTYKMGAPLASALWRTNHAYDPIIVSKQVEITKPFGDSETRYNILANSFVYYESSNKQIGVYEALNITSILGDKGDDFFKCPNSHSGINVLSVMFQPVVGGGSVHAAWEKGTGDAWRPAACNTYLNIDLSRWW